MCYGHSWIGRPPSSLKAVFAKRPSANKLENCCSDKVTGGGGRGWKLSFAEGGSVPPPGLPFPAIKVLSHLAKMAA